MEVRFFTDCVDVRGGGGDGGDGGDGSDGISGNGLSELVLLEICSPKFAWLPPKVDHQQTEFVVIHFPEVVSVSVLVLFLLFLPLLSLLHPFISW